MFSGWDTPLPLEGPDEGSFMISDGCGDGVRYQEEKTGGEDVGVRGGLDELGWGPRALPSRREGSS